MKKKILFIILLFIAGCSGIRESVVDFHKGTEGLSIDFLENAPPDEIILIEGNEFLIGVGMENRGAATILEGSLKITSFKDYIDIKGGSDCRFQKNINNGIICDLPRLRGKSLEMKEGEFSPLYLNAELDSEKINKEEEGITDILETINIESEYKYNTEASIDICVNDVKDVFDIEKSCEAKPETLSGQGAPVAVSKIEYFTSNINSEKNRIDFMITFEDKGSEQDKIKDNKINLDEISFSGYSTDESDLNKKIICDTDNKIELTESGEDKNMITCHAYTDKTPAYSSILKINFNYEYYTKKSKKIKIKKITKPELESWLEKEEETTAPEPYAPAIVETPEDIKRMIAERLKLKGRYGDFRNFKISKSIPNFKNNPSKEEILKWIDEGLTGKYEKARDKIRPKKVLTGSFGKKQKRM